jgi:peptidylprolyl isomerase
MLKKRRAVYIGILTCIFLFVAIVLPACSSAPTAKNGDTVQVDYTLTLSDGTVYQTSVGNQPLEFVLGEDNYLPDFEEAIVGMKVGESKTITILAADAYGERSDDLIFTLDRSQLSPGLDPKVGEHLVSTDASGQTVEVIVTAVTDTTITVDANFPLAGEDLTFKIDLLKIS